MFINYPQKCGTYMKILFLIIVLAVVYAYVLRKKETNTQKASMDAVRKEYERRNRFTKSWRSWIRRLRLRYIQRPRKVQTRTSALHISHHQKYEIPWEIQKGIVIRRLLFQMVGANHFPVLKKIKWVQKISRKLRLQEGATNANETGNEATTVYRGKLLDGIFVWLDVCSMAIRYLLTTPPYLKPLTKLPSRLIL